jgi:hypothetical protein
MKLESLSLVLCNLKPLDFKPLNIVLGGNSIETKSTYTLQNKKVELTILIINKKTMLTKTKKESCPNGQPSLIKT